MRLTIIKDDNCVYVDGVPMPVDCTALPSSFHALQWADTQGEIEWTHERNERITDLTPYQSWIENWTIANQEALALAEARRLEAEQAAIPKTTLGANTATPGVS